ncbi:hypothetical protein RR46_11567 [Papilio xuthus]|uniref:Uncharacterized protein n=1 Tax=Papilio xuthus TaxID=66420 RepID=A0A194PSW5_PAPXU|nr:hypothetical protein RR46_11567 [Papilio xuthus]
MPNKVVVGSVTEHLQSTDCTCVPCDCADCRSAIPSTSPHLMRETSTDMAETTNCRCDICFSHSCRQTRETCGCESRNSVISKPFEKDTKDIDIHRALITKSKGKTDQIEQTCTISVLTKIIKDYKKREARKAKKSKSEDTNKCLKCNSRMRCSSSLCEKSHYSTHHVKKIEVTKCQCSPCECDICEKLKTVDNGVWKSVKFRSKCFCDVCRCIYCGGELQTQNEADNEQDRPQTSHCGKKSENTSTFTSHQSMYPALLCEYPRPVNENAPMYNSNHYESDNLFKYTCDDCIRMVNGDKNEIKQINSDLSGSFCSCRAINSCHEPSHNLCSAEMLNFYESKHSLSDNKVVNNFVNEIMQIDEIKTNVEHENQNESSNSFDSTSWSFQEEQTRQNNSQISLKNKSEANENTIQKQETEVNEPCVFCGTFTLNTFSTNTGHKEGIQIIRECFAKTNLALLNDFDVNKEENENSISEDSDNGNLDENTQDSKDEFEYNDDYFEERSILFKAKLLTSELLKMLYEFQKANKDFDAFKNNSDYDTKSEENRKNLRSSQLGNMPRQDLLQILSLESKWNINGDTKLQENITNIENCQEDNVPFTNFKYSWSKTVLVNKRKNQIFPCYSKTDLTNDLNEFNYSETIYTEERTELGFKKINNNLAGNMNYLTRAEDLPKFKQSSIFGNEFSDNMQDCNRTINTVKYSNFEALNYADIVSAKKKKICDDNRHILIENILQNTKHEVNSK